jgi:hypothetical protein
MPSGQKFPELRQWDLLSAKWLPEKSDHPLQGKNAFVFGLNPDKAHAKNLSLINRYTDQLGSQ